MKLSNILPIIFFAAFLPFLSQAEKVLYVSPTGNDNNSGTTPEQALKSFDGARLKARSFKNEPVTVYFADGIYPQTQAIGFATSDSRTEAAPIVYRAAESAKPVFSALKPLSDWQILTDPDLLARLPEAVRGKVYACDVTAAGITNPGDPTTKNSRPELYCNDRLQCLSRYPNEGFLTSGQAKGTTPTPSEHNWHAQGTMEGIFEYKEDYLNRWADEPDARLFGYWFWDWAEDYHKIAGWNVATKTITVEQPYHFYGYRHNFRYYGLNLFCEIDMPGEWYLNRTTHKIYWYPPENIDPAQADVALSDVAGINMLSMMNCSNTSLKGLTFKGARGSAIRISNGENNLISECRIENFGTDAILIDGGKNNGVVGCHLSGFGYSGIRINGGDRKSLTPSGHYIEHNVIEDFSRFKSTYEPAIYFTGCGLHIANNRFQFAPSSVMRIDGNDAIVEYNQVCNVVTESDDQGAVDMWNNPSFVGNIFRYNHWMNIVGGTHQGAAAIRFDDAISYQSVYGNLFENCGGVNFGAIQIHGGKDNVIDNNIFYKCRYAASFTVWNNWTEYVNRAETQQKLFVEVNINSDVWKNRYPEMADIYANPGVNTLQNSLIYDSGYIYGGSGKQILTANVIGNNIAGDENFCLENELNANNMESIPFNQMGPKADKNPWLSGDKAPVDPATASEFLQLNLTCGNDAIVFPGATDISIYPNPASGRLYIRSEAEIRQVEIVDISGKTVLSVQPENGQVDLSGIPQGVYILRCTTNSNLINKKITIK